MPGRANRPPCVYEIAVVFLVVGAFIVVVGGVWLWGQASSATDEQIQVVNATQSRLLLPTSAQSVAQAIVPMASLPPAFSPTATITPSPEPSATFTETPTPTLTLTPTLTHTPTASLTLFPSLTATETPLVEPSPTFTALAPITGAPTPMAEFGSPNDDIINVLLLGNDTRPGRPSYRTDVIVIVAVNKTVGSVNMLSLPRDLYVYVPNYGYNRINTAVYLGESGNYQGGGVQLLRETIRYNLGIAIDAYAWVNFAGFEKIVDAVDGVDLVVDCALTDYKLKSPDLNPDIFASWEWTTLDVGLHHLDGPTALWYARSRVTTSDFDRNRRHQLLLRAIWHKFQSQNMWGSIPNLWEAFQDTVQTDLSLEQILSLAPLGIQLDTKHIKSYFIGVGQVEPFTTEQGGSVLRLKPGSTRQLITKFYTPPTQNVLFQESISIEVINQSARSNLDLVAQSRLAWEGFAPFVGENITGEVIPRTILYDYTGITKGSSLDAVMDVLGIGDADVRYQPDPNRSVDYQVFLGDSYDSCTYNPWQRWD